MKTLTDIIKEIPAGCNWLIRSDNKNGFMANIMTADFDNGVTRNAHYKHSEHEVDMGVKAVGAFAFWGDTPEEALERSLLKVKSLYN